ncbi:MAG: ParB N-terminal domain-containing protein [Geobacteraceae bacterium]|nr:ParB N-terminal domain-containing protein [Geobacteraceae bacterium]
MNDQIELFSFGGETTPAKPQQSPKPAFKVGKLYDVSPDSIPTNPEQPRKHFDDERLEQLADSISKHGLLQPLVCTVSKDGSLLLAAGERCMWLK